MAFDVELELARLLRGKVDRPFRISDLSSSFRVDEDLLEGVLSRFQSLRGILILSTSRTGTRGTAEILVLPQITGVLRAIEEEREAGNPGPQEGMLPSAATGAAPPSRKAGVGRDVMLQALAALQVLIDTLEKPPNAAAGRGRLLSDLKTLTSEVLAPGNAGKFQRWWSVVKPFLLNPSETTPDPGLVARARAAVTLWTS